VVNDKNGWLKMTATGFTFSEKEIKVKLTQESVAEPSPVVGVASTSQSAKSKVKTVTCIKGKLTKKVTSMNPKCPAGYKKK
jgi:dTDP-4-dehydrorhamnose 3,5-epimerase-like enzyme